MTKKFETFLWGVISLNVVKFEICFIIQYLSSEIYLLVNQHTWLNWNFIGHAKRFWECYKKILSFNSHSYTMLLKGQNWSILKEEGNFYSHPMFLFHPKILFLPLNKNFETRFSEFFPFKFGKNLKNMFRSFHSRQKKIGKCSQILI
jgi:hypothetical protein